jgi:RNA polymerase sigma-70 factor (ECF subfamily)
MKVKTELSKEDNQLLQILHDDREAAIQRIHSCYGKYLLLVANGILRNEQDAEECVNDVLMRLWTSELPNEIRNLKAYLAKMVRNLAIMYLRKRSRQKRGGDFTVVSYEELSECIPDSKPGSDGFSQSELAAQIKAFVKELSEVDRIVFMGRYWLSQSIPEIAKQIGKSEGFVTKRLLLLRERLKRRLEKGWT